MCSDVGHVAEVLVRSGLDGVKRIRIAMDRPLRPMLCQRVHKMSEIKEKIESDEIAAEEKYDGQRIQAHKDGDEVKLYSRRLEDITHQYPDVVESVKKHAKADKVILDGEGVAYNPDKNTYGSFQSLMHRRRKYDVEEYSEKVPVRYMVFDLLYLEGSSYLSHSYPERRKAIEDEVESGDGIAIAGRKVSSSLDEIEDFFQDCLERGLEGVVCKSCAKDSVYQAGAREWEWIKWKPSYAKNIQDTFDLVVVGAYDGKGGRSGTYGSLLCACYNDERDEFQTVTKVGSGYTDKVLNSLPDKFADLEVDKKPARVEATDKIEPDHWFTPKFVMEVLASEITQSPTHSCGIHQLDKPLALRFPRFKRWREEKAPNQATHTSEIIQMYKGSS
jgi:DNA ligase-1